MSDPELDYLMGACDRLERIIAATNARTAAIHREADELEAVLRDLRDERRTDGVQIAEECSRHLSRISEEDFGREGECE